MRIATALWAVKSPLDPRPEDSALLVAPPDSARLSLIHLPIPYSPALILMEFGLGQRHGSREARALEAEAGLSGNPARILELVGDEAVSTGWERQK
jgi:hypothetical protein